MKRPIRVDTLYLKQKSELLSQIELEQPHTVTGITVAKMFIKDLEDSLDLKRGIGLAGIQISIPKRISIIRMPKLKLDLINPIIIDKYDRFRFKEERCLSLPGLAIDTIRYKEITIQNGDGRRFVFEGLEAIVVQHEIDHMNGLLITDRKWRKRQ